MHLSIEEYTRLIDKMTHLTAINRDFKKDNILLNQKLQKQRKLIRTSTSNDYCSIPYKNISKQQNTTQTQSNTKMVSKLSEQILKSIQKTFQENLEKYFEKQKTQLQQELRQQLKSKHSHSTDSINPRLQNKEDRINNLIKFLQKIKDHKNLTTAEIISLAGQHKLINQSPRKQGININDYGSQFFSNNILKQIKQKQNRKPISQKQNKQTLLKIKKNSQNRQQQNSIEQQESRLESKLKTTKIQKQKKKDRNKLDQSNLLMPDNKNQISISIPKKKKKKQILGSGSKQVVEQSRNEIKKKTIKQINGKSQNDKQNKVSQKKVKNTQKGQKSNKKFRQQILAQLAQTIFKQESNQRAADAEDKQKKKKKKKKQEQKEAEVTGAKQTSNISQNKGNSASLQKQTKPPTMNDIPKQSQHKIK